MLRVTLALTVLGAVLTTVGCGGGSSSSGSSADEWASGFCSALTTWTASVKSAGTSLQGNASESGLKSAAGDIKNASDTLVDDLKGLGKPDTKTGEEARDAVDQLSKEVEQDVQEMQSAVDKVSGVQGALTAATSVAATLSKMGTQIGSAASKLDAADPDGELRQAFRDSSACKKLTSSSS
jgi:phage-related protein